jgi:PAS domain S-box-containing protein
MMNAKCNAEADESPLFYSAFRIHHSAFAPGSGGMTDQHKAAGLRGGAVPLPPRAFLPPSPERLDVAMEQLRVAQAELMAQNEELAAARDALDREHRRYQDLFDSAPDGYLVTDPLGKVLDANFAAASMLNLAVDQLTRKPLATYVAAEDKRAFRAGLLCVVNGERERGEWTLRLQPRRRPAFEADVSVAPVRDHLGRVTTLRWMIRDVSERRRAEQELDAYQRRLESMSAELALAEERERRRLAAALHDTISQPLAMAKMKLGQARQKANEPAAAAAIEAARQLLDEALQQTRSLTFEISPPVLYELGFVPAVEWLAERANKRDGVCVLVTGATSCRAARLPEPLAVLLFQTVRELLANVVKHAAARNVDVVLTCEGRDLVVVVRDDGRGFDPAEARSAEGDDTGFGLFHVRTRLEHLGGRFEVHSEPGAGTRVTVAVPLPPDSLGPAGAAPPGGRNGNGQA